MNIEKRNKHQQLRKTETIIFWILFVLFFLFSLAFLFISFLADESHKVSSITISFIIVAGVLAVLLIFIYLYGATKFQMITDKVDNYIRNKEYSEGIKYITCIKDINYFFISLDKIYYYQGILYLYDNRLEEAISYFDFLYSYSKSDTLVIYNSIKNLGLIYLVNDNKEGLKKLNDKYQSLRKSAAMIKTINKYTNSEMLYLYSILDKIFSDNEEKNKEALRSYIAIPLIKSYLEKKQNKKEKKND